MLLSIVFALLTSAAGSTRGHVTVKLHDGSDKRDYSEVVVFVADLPPASAHARAEVRQRGKQFVPRVLAVTAGTDVAFPNDDGVEHNVFSHSAASDFDLGRFGKGPLVGQTICLAPVHPLRPGRASSMIPDAHDDGPDDPGRVRRLDWAKLLKRIFAVDVLACVRCRGPMRLVAFVDDERVARKILRHLGLPARPPPRGLGRAGQQVPLDLVTADVDGIEPPLVFD
jgi:plastocyanin